MVYIYILWNIMVYYNYSYIYHKPYPLVMTNVAIENGHKNSEFFH